VKILLVTALVCFAFVASAQYSTYSFDHDLAFAGYLHARKASSDAVLVLTSQDRKLLMQHQRDTLDFTLGKIYYSMQDLDASSRAFSLVSDEASTYAESQFFAALAQVHTADYPAANKMLSQEWSDSLHRALAAFERSGIALLNRDFNLYNQLQHNLTYPYYAISEQQLRFKTYHQDLLRAEKKSPWVAGIMSAVIPGSGKVYAGKWTQGLMSFATVSLIGLQAAEGYIKGGANDWRFITFGSLFTIFYTANIWGSTLAVRMHQQEQFRSIDQQILFDLHIPLRNVFH
jgi:hypothetical protein